jgi:dihydrofolate reductase
MTGKQPTVEENEWGQFAGRTPHFVLSTRLTSALWPKTSFLRSVDEVAALKRQSGKDIYLIGGARTTAGLIGGGLVDELRLIVYPLIAGEGKALFATTDHRQAFRLRKVEKLRGGRASLVYERA